MTMIQGYLPETASQNKCLQSEDLGTTWTLLDAGDTVGGSVVAPNKVTQTKAGIIADATDGIHGMTQPITVTAVTWTFSCFAKKGNKDWLFLHNETVADADCYFNLATPAVGTAGAGAVGHMENFGDGWVRCSITFTGTAAAHTFDVQPAHADLDNTFAGDGAAINVYAWGMQCEIGAYMSSYIPTTVAAVTRNKDELTYKGDDGNIGGVGSLKKGTVACSYLKENYNLLANAFITTISDGAAAADRMRLYNSLTGDVCLFTTTATGGDAGVGQVAGDITDGAIHELRFRWQTDNVLVSRDGVDGTPDTAVDIPDDLDQIDIGMAETNIGQSNAVISNLRIFKKVTTKG